MWLHPWSLIDQELTWSLPCDTPAISPKASRRYTPHRRTNAFVNSPCT
jgi:hypothetical protein